MPPILDSRAGVVGDGSIQLLGGSKRGAAGADEHVPAGFVLGVNLPWVRYGDFGANAWQPHGGLAETADLGRVAARLDEARGCGASAVRWFFLCDGRAGIE